MERVDRELLSRLMRSDEGLRKLYGEHMRLEKEVARLERYAVYSPSIALRHRRLKKEKLRGMDNIMAILNHYRSPWPVAAVG